MPKSAGNSKQTLLQVGAAATPALAFLGDNDTGFFRDTANSVAVSFGGVTGGQVAGLSATQELTNKTYNAPILKGTATASGTFTMPAFTLGGTVALNGQSFSGTCANGGTFTTIDINGGTVDGAVIGGASAAAITGTTITSSTSVTAAGTGVPLAVNSTNNSDNKIRLQNNGTTTSFLGSTATEAFVVADSTTAIQFRVSTVASVVNCLQAAGAATGGAPSLSAIGADANVGLGLSAKGVSSITFFTNALSTRQMDITHTASAVNYLSFTGAATGSSPIISALGSDSNVNLILTPKGSGKVQTAAAQVLVASGTATPAGGTAGTGLCFGTTSNLGVFFGSGAPTLSAAQGSIYIRSDGSSTSTRLYVNTNGSTTWTNVTTAA